LRSRSADLDSFLVIAKPGSTELLSEGWSVKQIKCPLTRENVSYNGQKISLRQEHLIGESISQPDFDSD
jgi:hypothetical protein